MIRVEKLRRPDRRRHLNIGSRMFKVKWNECTVNKEVFAVNARAYLKFEQHFKSNYRKACEYSLSAL